MGFYKKRDGKLDPVAVIQVEELREWFPGMADQVLGEDTYMTVNGFWSPEDRGGFRRGEDRLRTLNTCYVDLDVGREEENGKPGATLRWQDAYGIVMNLALDNVIPWPSIAARSGQGMYFFWLLVDAKNPDRPPGSWKLDLYKRLNGELSERLLHVAADKAAKDGARILRVPESIHSKVQERVKYWVQCGDDMKPVTYTLQELAQFLGVEETRVPTREPHRREELVSGTPQSEPKPRQPRPNKAKGRIALARYRIADIEAVAKAQGIHQGNRRVILTHYVENHRIIETDPRDALNACFKLARLCKPFYPGEGDTPVEAIVRGVYHLPARHLLEHCKLRNDTLVRKLQITPGLARDLNLQTILPKEERERREAEPSKAQKRIAERRELLRLVMDGNPGTDLGTKAIAKFVAANGTPCSHMTVCRDLKAMGYAGTTGRSGRPRKGEDRNQVVLLLPD